MKYCIPFIIIILFTSLFSQFNQPVQVNEDLDDVFYRGNRACKVIDDEVFMTFVETYFENIYFAHSQNGEDFTYTLVDAGIPHYFDLRNNIQPCLEVLPTGEIVIFYLKESYEDYITALYKAISNDGGQTFVCDSLLSDISCFSSTTVDDKIYLSYQQGSSVALTNYQYFTDIEKSENADGGAVAAMVTFWGPDVLYGPVHSNDDIWIRQGGGGNNNGWPTFHEMVTTAKLLRKFPGGEHLEETGAPMSDIFLGGWAEGEDGDGIDPIIYNPSANLIRENGMWIGDENADIVYVKINGNSFEYMMGAIILSDIETFDVYSWFPHNENAVETVINAGGNWFEDSNLIYTNHISVYDIVWTYGGTIAFNNMSVFVNDAQLWIEGAISGAVTFGCSDTIYIVGDITYSNTIPGDPPDDPDNPNLTDYFGLVSEERIYIKYKHRDPFNNYEIRDDNCNNVMLYGAYAAIGIGDTLVYGDLACHYDGIFSFEYQHPHGSTPDFYAPSPYYPHNDTLYKYIDFHKFIFPITPNIPPNIQGFALHGNFPVAPNMTCGFPYEDPGYLNSYPNNNPADYAVPYGTDYPWYNPVWPESSNDIVYERGTITTFGSIAQRRRGFVHRSGSDPYNHPNDEWDLENFHYDGYHPSTGYGKDYHYDSRLLEITPPDYPVSNINCEEPKIVITVSEDAGSSFQQQQEWQFANGMAQRLQIASQDDIVAVAYQQFPTSISLKYSLDNGNTFAEFILDDLPVQSMQDLQVYDENIYIFVKGSTSDFIYKFDPYNSNLITLFEFYSDTHLSNFTIGNEGGKVYVAIEEPITYPGSFKFQYSSADPYVLSEEYVWQSPFNVYYPTGSVLAVNFNVQDSVFVSFLNAANYNHDFGDLYLAKGSLPEFVETDENEIVKSVCSLNIYPNPFNPETTISFNISRKDAKHAKIEIYNLKGQKVKTFSNLQINKSPNQQVIWNGTDESEKPVGSGIYFCRLKVNGKSKVVKKMVLVK